MTLKKQAEELVIAFIARKQGKPKAEKIITTEKKKTKSAQKA